MAAHNFDAKLFADDDAAILSDMERLEAEAQPSQVDPLNRAVESVVPPAPVPMDTTVVKPLMWGLVLAAASLLLFT